MASKDSPTLHVAMLPWLAFGHMLPFLHLSIALASAGHRISFLSTPRNIARLLPNVPQKLRSLVEFIEFPLPPGAAAADDRPLNGEATVDLPSSDEIPSLKISYDSLKHPIKHWIQHQSPHVHCIIHDFLPYWIVDVARDCSVPSVFFSIFSASFLTFVGPPESLTEDGLKRWRPSAESLTTKPEWVPFPSSVAYNPKEATEFYAGAFIPNASGLSDVERLRHVVEGCSAVAVRSCKEYEGEHLELLQSLYGKAVIPTGVLLPMNNTDQPSSSCSWHSEAERRVFEWLDKQKKPRSVVFVSFGSEYKLTEREVEEVAHGLELSGLPFLWALRSPAAEALPQGFVTRTEGRGLVSFGWVPQLEILAHHSIGGSLIHAGWGSLVETLSYGHAMMLLPCILDQGLNARFAVEKGVGVEVERDEEIGSGFSRDKIAKALITAMVSDEGEEMRAKAREMGATVFANQQLQDQYVMGFIDYIQNHCKRSSDTALSIVS